MQTLGARNLRAQLGAQWCAVMHDSLMWPIHDEYRCRTCGRRFPVPWGSRNRKLTALPLVSSASRARSADASIAGTDVRMRANVSTRAALLSLPVTKSRVSFGD